MTRRTTWIVTGLRIAYALFWVALAVAPLVIPGTIPRQPTQAANDFWDAIAATGFMVPLIGVTYFLGGALCLLQRTAPLGLAFLSAPLAVIVPFNIFLVRRPGPWILVVLVHVVLMFAYRAAYVRLWSYDGRQLR